MLIIDDIKQKIVYYDPYNKGSKNWKTFRARTEYTDTCEDSGVLKFLQNNEFTLKLCLGTRSNDRVDYKYGISALMRQRDGWNCSVFICLFVDVYLNKLDDIDSESITKDYLFLTRHKILHTILDSYKIQN